MEWQESDGMLIGMHILENFSEGADLIKQIAEIADDMNHHPTVMLTYQMLTVTTTTHDEGDTLTELDHILAKRISDLIQND